MNKGKAKEQKKRQAIDDKLRRINLKSKRKKTLIKKAIEISQMCQIDVLLVINDAEMSKMIEYNSGSKATGYFSLDRAQRCFDEVKQKSKKYQFITDDIYDRYVNGKRTHDFEEDDDSLDNMELSDSYKVPKLQSSTNKSVSLSKISLNLQTISKEIEKI